MEFTDGDACSPNNQISYQLDLESTDEAADVFLISTSQDKDGNYIGSINVYVQTFASKISIGFYNTGFQFQPRF